MRFLHGLRVLVLGLGDSGVAMASWAARCGASVRVWDSRETPPGAATLQEKLPGVERVPRELTDAAFDGVQLVLKSPGLAPRDARIDAPLERAVRRGLPVQGELDLFAQALSDLRTERGYAPRVLAITGTNGKTTTTAMAALLIARAGRRVAMAGNIGPTMLQTLADALDREPGGATDVDARAGFDRLSPNGGGRAHAEPTSTACASLGDGPEPQTAKRSELPSVHPEPLSVSPEPLSVRPEPLSVRPEPLSVRPEPPSVRPELVEGPDLHSVHPLQGSHPSSVRPALVETLEPLSVHLEPLSVHPEPLSVRPELPSVRPELVEGPEPHSIRPALVEGPKPQPVRPELVEGPVGINQVELPPGLVPPPPVPVFVHLPEVWVLELSSFQLHGVQRFEPSAGAVLNITQDHLDWHGTMADYAAAKARVFGRTGVMVINRDDPAVAAMVPLPTPGKGRLAKPVERRVVRFGLDAPTRPGDYGIVTEGSVAWLVRAMEADETVKPKRGAAAETEDLIIQRLMPADALRVRGRHNAANALAALALATSIGCPLAPMLHGLREYAGEPHRVAHVATIDGVDAYDDSKGTNVGATVAAISGLGADRQPARLVVILGGDGKGQDFAPLLAPLQRHARAVATIGRDAPMIEALLDGRIEVPVQRHETVLDAVRWCFGQARSGDAVLLSPACASIDMFRNYRHRADVFVEAVHEMASERGEVRA